MRLNTLFTKCGSQLNNWLTFHTAPKNARKSTQRCTRYTCELVKCCEICTDWLNFPKIVQTQQNILHFDIVRYLNKVFRIVQTVQNISHSDIDDSTGCADWTDWTDCVNITFSWLILGAKTKRSNHDMLCAMLGCTVLAFKVRSVNQEYETIRNWESAGKSRQCHRLPICLFTLTIRNKTPKNLDCETSWLV